MLVYNIEFIPDPYMKNKCCVCGVPWFSWDGFRWPMHSAGCPGHTHRALVPPSIAGDKVLRANRTAGVKNDKS